MEKFQDKYRIPSARAKWWNYDSDGIYFITICTSGHDYYFEQIIDKQMVLSEIGLIVQMKWEKSFIIRKELHCDAYVIMPNHIHAILRIENDDPVETHGSASPESTDLQTESHGVTSPESTNLQTETHCSASLHSTGLPQIIDAPPCVYTTTQFEHFTSNKNYGIAYRPPKSISSFVAGFKSVVTVNVLKINSCFGWQARFYDSIVQKDQVYQRIVDYLENNPSNWKQDKFFRNE